MTQGALIFAYNNSKIDYVRLAEWNAQNIDFCLGLPTTLITDKPVESKWFDQVIITEPTTPGTRYFDDVGTTVDWYNGNRVDAYELSPYDQTLLLDADYVIGSTTMADWLDSSEDFLCFRSAYDLTGRSSLDDLHTFGAHKFPMLWATVIKFNRCNQNQFIFDSMRMVRDNWQHYRNLYKIAQTNYRNDYALSIAAGLLSGHILGSFEARYRMATVMPDVKIAKVIGSNTSYHLTFSFGDKQTWLRIKDVDFHAMGKKHLGDLIAASN